jgi:hypothetical protein
MFISGSNLISFSYVMYDDGTLEEKDAFEEMQQNMNTICFTNVPSNKAAVLDESNSAWSLVITIVVVCLVVLLVVIYLLQRRKTGAKKR